MLDTDDIRYSFWLEKELEKNVKRLAGNVSRGCKSRHDAYKVRATQDAIRKLNGEKEASGVRGADERTDTPCTVYSDCKGV